MVGTYVKGETRRLPRIYSSRSCSLTIDLALPFGTFLPFWLFLPFGTFLAFLSEPISVWKDWWCRFRSCGRLKDRSHPGSGQG